MTDIRPTHQCFDDAIEQMGRLLRADAPATLVHGICVGDGGVRYAHAWVESGGLVWDAGLIDGVRVAYSVPLLEYLSAKRVEQTWRYALLDMARENRAHGTSGPWVKELHVLCGSDRRILGKIDATYTGRSHTPEPSTTRVDERHRKPSL